MNYNLKIINRIIRIQKHLNAEVKMMKKDSSCPDVITQLNSFKGPLQRLMTVIASENLIESIKVTENNIETSQTSIDEAISFLVESK